MNPQKKQVHHRVSLSRAIAHGATKMSEDECAAFCRNALNEASSKSDQYQKTSVKMSVISIYESRGMLVEANKLSGTVFIEVKSVIPSNSKAQALEHMSDVVWDLDPKYRRAILKELYEMIDSVPGWRIARACACVSQDFDQAGESQFVDQLLKSCRNEWLKKRVQRDRVKDGNV